MSLTRRPRRSTKPKRKMNKRKMYRRGGSKLRRTSDLAKCRETYQLQVQAGQMTFFKDALADVNFDRAINVARAYQQYRIAYMKLTFRPNNDTYPAGGAATLPQLYFMIDKTSSIPLNADAATLNSVGARPIRVDDKNIVRYWKPGVLTADQNGPGISAAQTKISPWLSTNDQAGAPAGGWTPDETIHHGAVFYITKTQPGDAQFYTVDVELLFEYRRPCWYIPSSSEQGVQTYDPVTHQTIKAPM